jgi:dihydroxyacetone kinase phosphotransfer subunit
MVGIVLISHSRALALEVARLCHALAPRKAPIAVAGGTDGGGVGTSAERIRVGIEVVDQGDGVLLLTDIGSSVLVARALVEEIGDETIAVADAPLVEGAVAATIIAGAGAPFAQVLAAAEETRGARKL